MDENGCDSLVYINLIVFEAFTFDTNIQAPTCFGEESGAITVLVEGENESFTYAINGGDFQNFNAFFNLEAGDYTVAVMDVNECVETTILTIDSPSVLNATISTQEATDNNANGTATVIAEGGTTPYTYEWATNPIQTTETATNLSTGTYSVIVTDANNCTWQGMVEVDLSTATPNIDRIENFQVFPNPVSDKAQVRIEIPSIAIGQLTLYNSTGQLLFTQGLEDVKSQQFSLDFSTYPAGIYWMTLSIEGTSYTKTIVKY